MFSFNPGSGGIWICVFTEDTAVELALRGCPVFDWAEMQASGTVCKAG